MEKLIVVGVLLVVVLVLLVFFRRMGQKRCPACAMVVPVEAKLCPHCRTDLSKPAAA